MRVFIPVFFKAPLGGLQSHVRAQADALARAGHECVIMCKPGPFAESLRQASIDVLETPFEDEESAVRMAQQAGPFDLVHAHPSTSRQVGLAVARGEQCPFLLTIHGMYTDSLPSYADDVDFLLAVSPGIRDYVLDATEFPADRVFITPNGVETSVFQPADPDWEALHEQFPQLADAPDVPTDRRVFFVSRLDEDKSFILDVVKECWREMTDRRAFDWQWWIGGDGRLRTEMETAARQVNDAAQRNLISFLGWMSEPALALTYNGCHVAIAPGRSALEAMACGRPTIAIGSKGYVGLIDGNIAPRGAYTNFGGFGGQHQEYPARALFSDLERVIYDDEEIDRLGKLSLAVIDAFFRQSDLDRELLHVYEIARQTTPRSRRWAYRQRVDLPHLSYAAPDGDSLSDRWYCPPDGGDRTVHVRPDARLEVVSNLAGDGKFYVATESTDFQRPPCDTEAWPLVPDVNYEFVVPVEHLDDGCTVSFWVIQFNDARRLEHHVITLRKGINRVRFRASAEATSFRAAFRFARTGRAVIGGIDVWRFAARTRFDVGRNLTRTHDLPPFGQYRGENLVFVFGSPHSGTTWVLNLLRAHPDIVAATVDNLAARINDNKTQETNIFNDNRPFTDAQIRYKFYCLSRANPGCVIVEKTPIHLLFVDRIFELFPAAAAILVQRDGRDVVTSLVHVGRDPSAWWQGAPATVAAATEFWKRYADAAQHCLRQYHTKLVRYEDLLHDPHAVLTDLIGALGLPTQRVAEQIKACRDGRGTTIPGVFRQGQTGGWKQFFTAEDIETFKRIAGDLLIELAYERDTDWGLLDQASATNAGTTPHRR